MAWQRLSARNGPEEALHEGVPPHLRAPLVNWLEGKFGYQTPGRMKRSVMLSVGSMVRVPLDPNLRDTRLQEQLLQYCDSSDEPNPSDAWDHAIKAIEAVFIPLVVPAQAKPQLGHVIGELRSKGQAWQFVLPGAGQAHSVDGVLGMLDLVWPNPDRHGGAQSRPPTVAEAEAVVHCAVTLVQWARAGALSKR